MKMKVAVMCGVVCLAAASAFAALSKDEVKRLNESVGILHDLRATPEKGIPDELWNKAQCVLVIPSLKKAALGIGGEYGSGVMSCRHANSWSAPVFMQLAKGSWGLQIGAQEIDLVLLVMNKHGMEKLLDDKVSLGADASVAAGPVGRSANAATDAQMSAEMLAYSRSQGLFAGVDISGGVLKPDKEADARAYGENVTPRNVLEGTGHIVVPTAAKTFITGLEREVSATTGRK
jgi:lipid-binding SYLF domain-containing protein